MSVGLRYCVANALNLWRDAWRLNVSRRPQGLGILRSFAEEEAAKFFILLDAIRCPREPRDRFARQLGYFNQHLAKGLYAEYYSMRPADLSEVDRYMQMERQTLYLDGPHGVDWVFRNDILSRREDSIYVDYVAYKDNFRAEHSWQSPNLKLMSLGLHGGKPRVLELALTFRRCGLTSARALERMATLWRPVDVPSIKWPELRKLNLETLQMLETENLLRPASDKVYQAVVGEWLFPLFPLDLSEIKVQNADLEDRQRRWAPEDSY